MKSRGDHINVTLPQVLRPKPGVPLVRIGRDNDGGYLMDQRNLDHADMLISMGIDTDWSFEEQFLAQRSVPLIAYDGSVSAWEFFVRFYRSVVLFEPINAKNALKLFVRFRRFFNRRTRIHRCQYISDDTSKRRISLETVLANDIDPARGSIFFKIDIEGSEYSILDTLVACADRIEGLAIEFHDVDRHMRQITEFVDAFPLTLCHVHGNNHSGVLEDGTPLVIECTFTRRPAQGREPVTLPHKLDMPCRASGREFEIVFADRGN